MSTEILLIGAGGHCRAVIDVIEAEGRFAIAGLVGKPSELGSEVCGYPVLGCDEDLATLRQQFNKAVVSIGQIEDSEPRQRAWAQLQALGFECPAIVSPRSWVSPRATVGAGTVVMHGAVINTGAEIAENCIINSLSLIEHDACIGAHSHVSTGAIVNGDVSIGGGSFLGSGCVVMQGLDLGENCIVGMSQSVRHNQPANSRVTGH